MTKSIYRIILCLSLSVLPACAESSSTDLPPPSPEPRQALQGGTEYDDVQDARTNRVAKRLPTYTNQPQYPAWQYVQNVGIPPQSSYATGMQLSGYANQPQGYVNAAAFTVPPQMPMQRQMPSYGTPGHPLTGNPQGGQDEYWVDWLTWYKRIGDCAFDIARSRGCTAVGGSWVVFTVYRDHRLVINQTGGPEPNGQCVKDIVSALQQVPVYLLEFPQGSQKQEKTSRTIVNAPLGMRGKYGDSQVSSQPEHIVRQW